MVLEGKPEKDGFQLVSINEKFKCAFITRNPQYAYGQVSVLKRHNKSDEIFTLILGEATLLTEEGDKGYVDQKLKIGVSYCVTAGTWHYLAVSDDALVFVVENSDVSKDNTDELCVEDKCIYISQNC